MFPKRVRIDAFLRSPFHSFVLLHVSSSLVMFLALIDLTLFYHPLPFLCLSTYDSFGFIPQRNTPSSSSISLIPSPFTYSHDFLPFVWTEQRWSPKLYTLLHALRRGPSHIGAAYCPCWRHNTPHTFRASKWHATRIPAIICSAFCFHQRGVYMSTPSRPHILVCLPRNCFFLNTLLDSGYFPIVDRLDSWQCFL